MVVVGQSDSSEGTRQLRVNKKLSKAISSVSRSRFAKPRPNLPGAKRSDSNAAARPCKAVERTPEVISQTIQQNVDTDTSECTPKVETVAQSAVTDTSQIIQEVDGNTITQTTNTDISQIVQEVDDSTITQTTNTNICKTVQEVNNVPQSTDSDIEKPVQEVDDKVIAESSDSDTGKIIADECNKVQTEDTNISEVVQEVDIQTIAQTTNIDTGEDIDQEVDDPPVAKITNTDVSGINEGTENNNTILNSSALKIPAVYNEVINQTAVTNVISSPDSPVQKKSIQSNSPDKSSKYPHLTSLLTKKKNDLKKEAQKKMMRFKKLGPNPERSKMTMADLIYWNPTNTEQTKKSTEVPDEVPSSNVLSNIEEECVDDAPPESDILDSVPKLVISEDGSINIDQSSLFVSRNVPQPTITEVINKDDTTYSSFRKRPLTKHWNAKDTARFYKALSLVGSDFSLMEKIFPHRTRRELKQKFKREEKFNINLINRVLYETHTFDDVSLSDFINEDADSLTEEMNSEENASEGQKPNRKRKNTKKTEGVDEACIPSNEHSGNEAVCPKVTKKRRKTKKKNTGEDQDEFECELVDGIVKDLEEKEGSKRQRHAKKLPDGFVSSDCIDEIAVFEEEECNENGVNENVLIDLNEENIGPQGLPKIVASLDFPDLKTFKKNIKFPSNSKKKKSNKVLDFAHESAPLTNLNEVVETVPQSDPPASADEEYLTVECTVQEVSDDVTMLNNVMAFEVVTSLSPPAMAKRRRKVNPILPRKVPEPVASVHLSSSNYTPVL